MNTADTTGRDATRWRLEPAPHSSAEFRVPHFWGLVKVKGHFDRLDGWFEIDQNGHRRLELIIDVASLNTGNRRNATSTSAQRTSSTHSSTPRCASTRPRSATPETAVSTSTAS